MRKVLLSLLIVSALAVNAQQDPQFTQNFANKLYNNPGFAGMNGAICATGIVRQQWLGFDGAPKQIVFSGHSPILGKLDIPLLNLGVGLSFSNDVIGQFSINQIKLAIANRFVINNVGTISAGFGLGTQGVSIDGTKFVPSDGIEALGYDPNLLAKASAKDYGFDMDFGLYYRSTDEKIFAGVSMMHITQSQLEGQKDGAQSNKYQVESNLYIMGGYRYPLTPEWELIPSVFVKTEFSTTQFDLNVLGEYKEMLWGGLSYRFQDAVAPMVGYRWNGGKFGVAKIGASYDVNTSKLNKYNSGTVEVFLNYCFKIIPKPKITIHKNPRWL
ncbi:MAG: type IX secretion system membrane protein PorP/SprF [Flavobacteriales bacterium]|nr:type IX secretion system membrane protein PorP/SprF [Flavobacteriales bacterium]